MHSDILKYNNVLVYHKHTNAWYTLVLAGTDLGAETAESATYQAYQLNNMSHRLWLIPQTFETVAGMFRTGVLATEPLESDSEWSEMTNEFHS